MPLSSLWFPLPSLQGFFAILPSPKALGPLMSTLGGPTQVTPLPLACLPAFQLTPTSLP